MTNNFKSQQENLDRCDYLLICKVDHFKIENMKLPLISLIVTNLKMHINNSFK